MNKHSLGYLLWLNDLNNSRKELQYATRSYRRIKKLMYDYKNTSYNIGHVLNIAKRNRHKLIHIIREIEHMLNLKPACFN